MGMARFIQIHTLHNYPAALLNRDDAGLAKRLPYGNAIRTRISSQCLKRHWRTADDLFSLSSIGVPMAVRSRRTLELIRDRLVESGASDERARHAAEALRAAGLLDKGESASERETKSSKGKPSKSKGGDPEGGGAAKADQLVTGQAVLLGQAEIDYLVKHCADLAKMPGDEKALKDAVAKFLSDERENIRAMKHGSGLESALFGRMVTSDVLASRDAAIYVAHAFTVHEAQVENDYFTVVDDLLRDAGEASSAGIFDTELASGLYYGYVVIDVPQLIANLEGVKPQEWASLPADRRELSATVVQHLMHLIATVSPGAKRGSTAPFEWAKFMLVEAGDWQPRTLAGAFHNALEQRSAPIRQTAARRMVEELESLDAAFGAPIARRFMSVDDVIVKGAERLPLGELAQWAHGCVVQGQSGED